MTVLYNLFILMRFLSITVWVYVYKCILAFIINCKTVTRVSWVKLLTAGSFLVFFLKTLSAASIKNELIKDDIKHLYSSLYVIFEMVEKENICTHTHICTMQWLSYFSMYFFRGILSNFLNTLVISILQWNNDV